MRYLHSGQKIPITSGETLLSLNYIQTTKYRNTKPSIIGLQELAEIIIFFGEHISLLLHVYFFITRENV